MSEAVDRAATNREAALLAEAEAREAERRALLWRAPVLADRDVPDALNLPPSAWNSVKSEGGGPPLFTIGRRVFVRTDDLRAWLDQLAAQGKPGSKRIREAARRRAA
ncbi:MAG: hypothetical protein M0015_16660 [Betaproteobacteria bacterium]|nr:hypothetical protein [Betaproteobacteria bacterium]